MTEVRNIIGSGAKIGSLVQLGEVHGSVDFSDGGFTIRAAPGTEPPPRPLFDALLADLASITEAVSNVELSSTEAAQLRAVCQAVLDATNRHYGPV